MAGKKVQKKRCWSDEEKVSICAQTCASGVSVAQVARRYAMNTNLIRKCYVIPSLRQIERSLKMRLLRRYAFSRSRLWTSLRPNARPRRLTPNQHVAPLRSTSRAVINCGLSAAMIQKH